MREIDINIHTQKKRKKDRDAHIHRKREGHIKREIDRRKTKRLINKYRM